MLLIVFVLILLIAFVLFANDPPLYSFLLLAGGLGLPAMWTCAAIGLSLNNSRSYRFRIKYSVVGDRITVSNLESGICIFDFHLNDVSCIESKYNNSNYLKVNRDGTKEMSKRGHSFTFIWCNKPCLLISSPRDEYKQRIPIGYSEEMILKLKELRFGL